MLRSPSHLGILAAAALLGSLPAGEIGAQRSAGLRTSDGVIVATFMLPQGAVLVYLPERIHPGDRVSGSVRIEPSGATESERRANSEVLGAYIAAVRDERGTTIGRVVRFVVPHSSGDRRAYVGLMDDMDRVVAQHEFTLPGKPPPLIPARAMTPPVIGRAGHPVVVHGTFNGGSSRVTVAGALARVLAESPRELIFESPLVPVGITEVVVSSGSAEVRGPYRNVRLTISQPRQRMQAGERGTVTIVAEGLDGDEPPAIAELRLSSTTPGAVTFHRASGAGVPETVVRLHSMYAAERLALARAPRFDVAVPFAVLMAGVPPIEVTMVDRGQPRRLRTPAEPDAPIDLHGVAPSDLTDRDAIPESRLGATRCDLFARLRYSERHGGGYSTWLRLQIHMVEKELGSRGLPPPPCRDE